MPYRTAYHNYDIILYAYAPLIDGPVHATRSIASCTSATHQATYLSQASCVIVSGFRAVLDLDTYPLSNVIRLRCAKRAEPGRGMPVLILHIGFSLVYIVLY